MRGNPPKSAVHSLMQPTETFQANVVVSSEPHHSLIRSHDSHTREFLSYKKKRWEVVKVIPGDSRANPGNVRRV